MKTTISVIKADIGGYVGHSSMHPALIEKAEDELRKARDAKLILDFSVIRVGDDLDLVMTHTKGDDSPEIHGLAWRIFEECTEIAKELGLYGAGQDLLADSFSGNVKGIGPGVAEMTINERPSEPIVIFCADKTSPSAWNLPLFEMFGDPQCTAGLVIDPKLHDGFVFHVLDVYEGDLFSLACPEEMYDLLAIISGTGRYVVKAVTKRDGTPAASASVQKLNFIKGEYVGKDDPVLITRGQSGFPAVGELLEPFARPHLVDGWMRGSHIGPLMAVPFHQANPSRFDGPPRVIAAGYQLRNGRLVGPRDMFDDPAFDYARETATLMANYMRRQGIFEPHRLPEREMEYTTLPHVLKRLKAKMKGSGSSEKKKGE